MASENVIAPPAIALKAASERVGSESEWLEVGGLCKPQAEQLLDWLETHGYEHRQIVIGLDESFVVRYRLPESY
jgi:hypothetical protein